MGHCAVCLLVSGLRRGWGQEERESSRSGVAVKLENNILGSRHKSESMAGGELMWSGGVLGNDRERPVRVEEGEGGEGEGRGEGGGRKVWGIVPVFVS